MSHPDYINIGTPETKMIEECSEVIQSLCKVQRFGWFSTHPKTPDITNMDEVESELKDIEGAILTLREHMKREIKRKNIKSDTCPLCLEKGKIYPVAATAMPVPDSYFCEKCAIEWNTLDHPHYVEGG